MVILITGASSGIGEAIALYLAKKGHTVYGTSRKDLPERQGIRFLKMNVDDDESVKAGVAQILGQEGRIDSVVNSAGTGILGSVEEVPLEAIKAAFETNVFGTIRVCQAAIPAMRSQGSGCIINVSSIAGEVGLPFRGYYAASKFAVEGFTESLNMGMASFGVRAVILQSGGFNTNIAQNRPEFDLGESSPYAPYLGPVRKKIHHEVANAPTPERLGPLVERILNNRRPHIRYKSGAFLEKIAPLVKRFAPWRLYEWLILGFHGMRR